MGATAGVVATGGSRGTLESLSAGWKPSRCSVEGSRSTGDLAERGSMARSGRVVTVSPPVRAMVRARESSSQSLR